MESDFLNSEEQKILLELSRKTLETYISKNRMPEVDESDIPKNLKSTNGAFVTLYKNKELRGCIGHIISDEPLYKCIIENSINAAVNDSRFSPVTQKELNDIDIEISVLTRPKYLEFNSPEEIVEKLTSLKDGVILTNGIRQSTFLPQVWKELPDKVKFLEHLCIKQGSSPDAWKNDGVEIQIYHAQVFSEK